MTPGRARPGPSDAAASGMLRSTGGRAGLGCTVLEPTSPLLGRLNQARLSGLSSGLAGITAPSIRPGNLGFNAPSAPVAPREIRRKGPRAIDHSGQTPSGTPIAGRSARLRLTTLSAKAEPEQPHGTPCSWATRAGRSWLPLTTARPIFQTASAVAIRSDRAASVRRARRPLVPLRAIPGSGTGSRCAATTSLGTQKPSSGSPAGHWPPVPTSICRGGVAASAARCLWPGRSQNRPPAQDGPSL